MNVEDGILDTSNLGSLTGNASKSAFSFSTHSGIPSGPLAFLELSVESFLNTSSLVMERVRLLGLLGTMSW